MKNFLPSIVAIVVIGTGIAYYAATRTPAIQKAMEDVNIMPSPGTMLAGTSAPLIDFTKTDFEKALVSDKLIILYFYANWCLICAKEFPIMQSAFNELTSDQVIGFRVNFNDNQTDDDEVALAQQHGVAYQHTKVFVKDGQQVLKSPESWEKDRYLSEINNAI